MDCHSCDNKEKSATISEVFRLLVSLAGGLFFLVAMGMNLILGKTVNSL